GRAGEAGAAGGAAVRGGASGARPGRTEASSRGMSGRAIFFMAWASLERVAGSALAPGGGLEVLGQRQEDPLVLGLLAQWGEGLFLLEGGHVLPAAVDGLLEVGER